jgi:hypothetical protein
MTTRLDTRSGCTAASRRPLALSMKGATTTARSEPTASSTATASSVHCSKVGGEVGDPRSDNPTPRRSKRMSLLNDANRRWNRAIDGSSSTHSMGTTAPVKRRRSSGPPPSTW